jgi:hypothetical protein
MNKRLQIDHLGRLLHMEVHLVSGFDSAMERVGSEDVRDRLEAVRGDHEQHVLDVTELLREMGEPSPSPSPEVDGLFAPATSALKNESSEEDVLQAVRMMEQVLARSYDEARNWSVGMQVHELLERNGADEQRDLTMIAQLTGAAKRGRARG